MFGNAAYAAHFLRPGAVFHVEEQGAARVRTIGGELSAKAIDEVVFGQHYPAYAREDLPLVLPHPHEFGRGEPGKGDVAREAGKLAFAHNAVQVLSLRLRPAVVPQNGGADEISLLIQRDKPVHLPRRGYAAHERPILPFQQLSQAGERFDVPHLRVLLAPSLLGMKRD